MIKNKEKISIDEFDGKRYQIRFVEPNENGKAVIHFDTEQSEADQQYFVNSTLKRANYTSTPEYYQSYNIRQLTLENYKGITDDVCELSNEKFNGIHLIIIDGGADYLASVNDEEASVKIIEYFTHLAIKYKCPVIIIIHLNPGSEKERGHFGSTAQRKCYGLLTIKKEGDISTVEPKLMRKAGNGDIPLLHFTFSKEKGYHIQIDAPNKEAAKAVKEMDKVKVIAYEIFVPPISFTHTEAVEKIMQKTGRGKTTAKAMLDNMKGWGFLVHGDDKRYRLKQESANEKV
jgi:hypothetical protein